MQDDPALLGGLSIDIAYRITKKTILWLVASLCRRDNNYRSSRDKYRLNTAIFIETDKRKDQLKFRKLTNEWFVN